MDIKKLSIIVPCYNEEKTLEVIIDKVLKADRCGLDIEIVVDDHDYPGRCRFLVYSGQRGAVACFIGKYNGIVFLHNRYVPVSAV